LPRYKCQRLHAVQEARYQGQTSDLVLIHVETASGPKDLLNSRMAYVNVSRGAP
jgi:hypothetical protein